MNHSKPYQLNPPHCVLGYNKAGPFSTVTRQDAKGDVCQLCQEWFYKVVPNGEKILRSRMVFPSSGRNYTAFTADSSMGTMAERYFGIMFHGSPDISHSFQMFYHSFFYDELSEVELLKEIRKLR
ncbi:hypothetical protein Btru_041219 [Bulinus truncatus]|nr:hypothetical protein Btru_041219 [Bulinus truncatus]